MTYGQQTVIDGFTLPQMIWYLVIAETIILSMVPFHRVLEKEIREGDIAIRAVTLRQVSVVHRQCVVPIARRFRRAEI